MAKAEKKTDSTRASRDGHEFHEAWVARKAMRLLLPDGGLAGMAVEGLSPSDQKNASSETVQVADLALYYGGHPSFADSRRTVIVQFKYSVARKDSEFRASDARETVEKFAIAYRDFEKRHGAEEVRDKLYFRLITNRPVSPALNKAITGLAKRTELTGDAERQADRLKKAANLDDERLTEFASKFSVTGLAGNLGDIKKDLSKILADWSAARDAVASARLDKMKQMVRDKAGTEGEGRNVITRMDVLAALGIASEDDLLPCPSKLPEVGEILEREQLAEVIARVPSMARPLLVHAAGGMGKTVFMRSLAEKLKDGHEAVFFDCFAGGAYRSPEDSRHLPGRGLAHIVNTLAHRGLCDPMLPENPDLQSLLGTFRRRLEQSVGTLAKASPERKLLLFLDAIDNAEVGAQDRGEDCFPTLLLKSFRHDPPEGVKVVASSRSHRIPGDSALYEKFKLSAFSREETKEYLRTLLPDATDDEIRVAQARSRGNPRILDYLVKGDRSRLGLSEIDKKIELDDLIQSRIDDALSNAYEQGYETGETDSFLAGLAVLPPPVPLEEYARSQGVEESAAESFAVDMHPLLERTEQGLTFRDEPTETLIREEYGSSEESLRRIADNLRKYQDQSVYAARALPELLYRIGDGGRLFELAFDETFPEAVTGTVGTRNIRYARLNAALRHAADRRNYGQLVGLLVEMSTVAGADRLGAEYILDHPDLVVAAGDADAVRRLFETRTPWPGTRHARLAVANALSGDMDEAHRHAIEADGWIDHWYSQPKEKRRVKSRRESPADMDIAAIPFLRTAEGRLREAGEFMRGWKYWYAYRVWEHVFAFSSQAESADVASDVDTGQLEGNIGALTAMLSFIETDEASLKRLVAELSEACGGAGEMEFGDGSGPQKKRRYDFSEGLCKACGIALSLGLRPEASTILSLVSEERPDTGGFDDYYLGPRAALFHANLFILRVASAAAAERRDVRERDIIPKDLMYLCESIKDDIDGDEFREKFMEKVDEIASLKDGGSGSGDETSADERKREAKQFMNCGMTPLTSLAGALSRLLGSRRGEADEPFADILKAWADAEKTADFHGTEEFSPFFHMLGRRISTFALWTRKDLGDASVKAYIKRLHEREPAEASTVIEVVGILAKRPTMRALAGEEAVKARSLIECETDVRDRAYFYAGLARAILPGSAQEAAEHFGKGLEEVDAVGSERDYGFVNELLLFAASLEGEELDEKDFHKLTDICELNVSEEPERFPWIHFGQGLSKVAGCRGLAKLSRWDDRAKIPLGCTLLPYLTALVNDGKIDPEDALALNRLAAPEEFVHCGSGTLAAAVESRPNGDKKKLVSEAVAQFMENRHGFPMYEASKELASVAGRVSGERSETAAYLEKGYSLLKRGREFLVRNALLGSRGERTGRSSDRHVETRRKERKVAEIVARAETADMESLEKAIGDFEEIHDFHYPHEKFFEKIREKVPYGKRADYVRMLAEHETLDFSRKLDELTRCRNSWKSSSASIAGEYEKLGKPITVRHADDLTRDDRISGYELKRISEISRIPIPELALELVKNFTGRRSHPSREVWLALSYHVCEKAREDEGRKALSRLLNGPAAKLSHKASDGEWQEGLYPNDNPDIFSGMLWKKLGSPDPEDRWRAAHGVRCFAGFGRWRTLDALVDKMDRKDAGAFQAAERPFYFMHAKLWLLVALARIALDEPKAVAEHKDVLLEIAFNEENHHVLMKHFAAEAVRTCVKAGEVELSDGHEKSLSRVNGSPFPRSERRTANGRDRYDGRPESLRWLKSEFSLVGRLYGHDIRSLGRAFGKAGQRVRDLMSDIVKSIDPEIENRGKSAEEVVQGASTADIETTRASFHAHVKQISWHALFMAAGRLLENYPVTGGRWDRWLGSFLLAGEDGLWLSDGMDRAPLGALRTLLEETEDGLALPRDESKILELVNPKSGEVVVAGEWDSADMVRVHVESALVRPEKVRAVARRLFREDPESAWLPNYLAYEGEGEYPGTDKDDCEPWIAWKDGEGKLDKDDPLGSAVAVRRPRIARNFRSTLSLERKDPFGRLWQNGQMTARSAAWGHGTKGDRDAPGAGLRLACSESLLKELLSENQTDMLLLIKLRRYEKAHESEPDINMNKTVVVRIKQTLEIEVMPQDS